MKLTFFELLCILAITLIQCNTSSAQIQLVKNIPVPAGYERIPLPSNSFGHFLRHIKLKADNTVYLFNKTPKSNQTAHYAVLDISVGEKDLQQCADAIMRLRSEYLKEQNQSICFTDNAGRKYCWSDFVKKDWQHYLNHVFSCCGTLSLEKELLPISWKSAKPGDVIIKGGSPGHAVIIMDMAKNKITGNLIFLLAQSYMPAQDIHLLVNKKEKFINPWYSVPNDYLFTPEWTFELGHLRSWK
jgi:hypothetical protein